MSRFITSFIANPNFTGAKSSWLWTLALIGSITVTACTGGPSDAASIDARNTAVAATVAASNASLARDASQPTAVPPTPAPQPPTPTPLPQPEGTIPPEGGFRQFNSTIYSYTVLYPTNWTAVGDGVRIGELQADLFLSPRKDPFTPNVNILATPLAPSVSSDDFFEASVAELERNSIDIQNQHTQELRGRTVLYLRYGTAAVNVNYTVNQALFVERGAGWVVTLSTQESDVPVYLPLLEEMVRSMQVR